MATQVSLLVDADGPKEGSRVRNSSVASLGDWLKKLGFPDMSRKSSLVGPGSGPAMGSASQLRRLATLLL
jgi:hypothetical protein